MQLREPDWRCKFHPSVIVREDTLSKEAANKLLVFPFIIYVLLSTCQNARKLLCCFVFSLSSSYSEVVLPRRCCRCFGFFYLWFLFFYYQCCRSVYLVKVFVFSNVLAIPPHMFGRVSLYFLPEIWNHKQKRKQNT